MKTSVVISIAAAAAIAGAAAGAAAVALRGGPNSPGDGSITCPGGAACPGAGNNNRVGDHREWYGIAVPKDLIDGAAARQIICNGTNRNGCPPGYVGRLEKMPPPSRQKVYFCEPGKPIAGVPCDPDDYAIVCKNPNAPKKPTEACPGLPGYMDPDYAW